MAAHPVVDVVEVQRVTRHPRRERHVASRAGEVGADEAGAVPVHPESRRLAGEGGGVGLDAGNGDADSVEYR